jgi:FhaA, N-terminal domain/FHA domain
MSYIADLERLLERVFERSSARLFRTRIQVVQLERRVERAMEHARLAGDGRTGVPSRYRVRLEPRDLAAVAEQAGGAEALAGRLADAALAFARAHAYHLASRPTVSLVADPAVAPGEIAVDPQLEGRPSPAPVAAAPAPGAGVASPSAGPRGPEAGLPETGHEAAAHPGADPGADPAVDPALTGIRGDGDRTLVFRKPVPPTPRACLRVTTPDGSERTIQVDGTPLTIGRSHDNGLVLGDARVSRRHGRLQARYGALVYTDLGSTNGTRVNGIRVDEIVLGAGDRLLLGDTVVVVETLPG